MTRPKAWSAPPLVLPLLQDIEHLSEDSTGALVFRERGETLGAVFVQGGCVCWAVASHMRGRLTDLLIARSGGTLERTVIETVYKECRARRLPLGEMLVASGHIPEEGLRDALRLHTAEAMLFLGRSGTTPKWMTHTGSGYDPRFVFSPADIYVQMCSLWQGGLGEQAEQTLRDVLPEGTRGVAFSAERDGLPIACVGGVPERLHDLWDVGRWALCTLDLGGALDAEQRVLTFNSELGTAAALWRDEQCVYLALCTERSELAYVIARRNRRRRREA